MNRIAAMAMGALALAGLTTGLARRPAQGAGPPGLDIGTKVFHLEPVRPATQLFPGYGPTAQVVVRDIRGPWLLLEFPAGHKRTAWVNFDQVVSYTTEQ